MKRLISALALLATFSACAHLQTKQTAVVSLQSAETALGNAQDFERAAYKNGSIPGLTLAVHQNISKSFSKAFASQIIAATVLKAWKAGDPVPTSVVQFQTDVDAALNLANAILPSIGQKTFVSKLQAVVDQILQTINNLKAITATAS